MESHSAIGIDIGTQNSVVATVKKGGLEILLNESSNRLTP
jgi:molecular chaperone DnaK (HSP70)